MHKPPKPSGYRGPKIASTASIHDMAPPARLGSWSRDNGSIAGSARHRGERYVTTLTVNRTGDQFRASGR
jgi:hypothetical protein